MAIDISTRSHLREATLALVGGAGDRGFTVRELRETLQVHHGSASGALSTLHKNGDLARLSETRMRNKVYVTPRHVNGRDTETQGRSGKPVPVEAPMLAAPIHVIPETPEGSLRLPARKARTGESYLVTIRSAHRSVLDALHAMPDLTDRDLGVLVVSAAPRRCELRDLGLVEKSGINSDGTTWRLTEAGRAFIARGYRPEPIEGEAA